MASQTHLVAIEGRCTCAETLLHCVLCSGWCHVECALCVGEVPYSEGAVERSRDETLAIGREGDTVDRVLVALETLDLLTGLHVPDADHRVEGSCGHELAIRRKSNGSDTGVDGSLLVVDKVLNAKVEDADALLNVPDACRLVARSRDQESSIAAKVERINFLHVTLEKVSDTLLLDVPNLLLALAQ